MGLMKLVEYSLKEKIIAASILFVGAALLTYLTIQSCGALPAAFMIGCSLYGLYSTGGFLTGIGLMATLFIKYRSNKLSYTYSEPNAVGAPSFNYNIERA